MARGCPLRLHEPARTRAPETSSLRTPFDEGEQIVPERSRSIRKMCRSRRRARRHVSVIGPSEAAWPAHVNASRAREVDVLRGLGPLFEKFCHATTNRSPQRPYVGRARVRLERDTRLAVASSAAAISTVPDRALCAQLRERPRERAPGRVVIERIETILCSVGQRHSIPARESDPRRDRVLRTCIEDIGVRRTRSAAMRGLPGPQAGPDACVQVALPVLNPSPETTIATDLCDLEVRWVSRIRARTANRRQSVAFRRALIACRPQVSRRLQRRAGGAASETARRRGGAVERAPAADDARHGVAESPQVLAGETLPRSAGERRRAMRTPRAGRDDRDPRPFPSRGECGACGRHVHGGQPSVETTPPCRHLPSAVDRPAARLRNRRQPDR